MAPIQHNVHGFKMPLLSPLLYQWTRAMYTGDKAAAHSPSSIDGVRDTIVRPVGKKTCAPPALERALPALPYDDRGESSAGNGDGDGCSGGDGGDTGGDDENDGGNGAAFSPATSSSASASPAISGCFSSID